MFGLVCLLKNKPPGLGDLWFPLCLYMEAGGMGVRPGSSGAGGCRCWGQEESEASVGAKLSSCPWLIPAVIALPGHSGVLLAAPHVAPTGTHTAITGCSTGLWDTLQTAAGSETLGQPQVARSRCSSRPWELFGAMHLHNRDACTVASQLGYKLFRGL